MGDGRDALVNQARCLSTTCSFLPVQQALAQSHHISGLESAFIQFSPLQGFPQSLQCNRSPSYHFARQKQSWRFSYSDCTTISKSSGSLHGILSVKGFIAYSMVGLGIRMRGRHFLSTAGVFIMPDRKLL